MCHRKVGLGLAAFAAAVGAFTLLGANPARGQVAGQNVNMVSGTKWPGGDPFLQRQNEPSLDVSTRNPLHLLAGANDYRTVDLPVSDTLPTDEATGDAWLGLFKSFDGGRTWQSTLIPGYPQDTTPEGRASPLFGFQAAADPTIRAGTNGLFYYSGIAFNRGDHAPGMMFVARLIDNNDRENGDVTKGRDPIKYIGTSIVDKGNAGQFLDKPSLAVDVPRTGSGNCTVVTPMDGGGTLSETLPAGTVYVAYSVFLGNGNNVHSALLVARSADCGATWSKPVKISEGNQTNQGTAIAIDPRNGTVYVTWRRFANHNQSDAILVASSTDGGKKFSKGTEIVALPSFDAVNPVAPSFFDQGTTALSFRTNAYPTMAVDGAGRLYVAWSQRGIAPGGDARVVISTSADGNAWSTPYAVDNGPVLDDEGAPFSILSGRGHQLMPAMRFVAGRLTLVYYDTREDHTVGDLDPINPAPDPHGLFFSESRVFRGELPGSPGSVFTPFLTDAGLTIRRHTIDVEAAQADPGPAPAFTPLRVSRYVFGSRPAETLIEQLQVNAPNFPIFQQGTVPFMGDYVDVAGAPPFVPGANGNWAYNTAPSGSVVFHAAWTDNRDVRPPADGDWTHYTPVGSTGGASVFDPTQNEPQCASGQAGMRNQNIYTARITQGLVVTTPSNFKQLGTVVINNNPVLMQRAFVAVVQNTTKVEKSFRLTIANQPVGGWASFLQVADPLSPGPLTTLDLNVAPRSSASRSVFIASTDPHASVTVNVAEIAAPGPVNPPLPGGLQGSLVFNPDVSNPDVSNPDVSNPDVSNPDVSNPDVNNPDVSNPDVSNLSVSTPDVSNPDVSNPDVSNPDVSNPDVSNAGLTDASFTVTNDGNTTASYHVKLFGNPPVGAKLQLILSKVYSTPVGVGCSLTTQPQTTVVANIVNPTFTTDSSTLSDPETNNPDVSNATIALAPGETGLITLRGSVGKGAAGIQAMQQIVTQLAPVVVAHGVNVNAPPNFPPPIATPLFITTTALPDAVIGTSYSLAATAIGGTGGRTWSATGLPAGLSIAAASGVVSGAPQGPAGTSSVTATVMDSSSPVPRTASRSFPLRVFSPLEITSGSPLPAASAGITYADTLTTIGGAPPVTWSVILGSLPTGVTVGVDTGLVSGTPTVTGTYTFTIAAADSIGLTATKVITLAVNPAITTAAIPTAFQNRAFPATRLAGVGAPPLTWAAAATLPDGLFLTTDGLLAGVPTGAGAVAVSVTVTDANEMSATATYPLFIVAPTTTFANLTVSNVKLDGGDVEEVVPGGGSFYVSFDYTIVDASCPLCIEQIQVGLSDGSPQTCAYNGIPGPQGASGSSSVVLIAPTLPGRYYIGIDRSLQYFCQTTWWSGAPDPTRYIGAIDVIGPTATDGPVTISNVTINNGGNSGIAQVGSSYTVGFAYTIVDTACPGCIDQIELGLATGVPETCGYDGVPGPSGASGVSGSSTVTMAAPTIPGRYYVGFDRAQDFGCLYSGAFWWNGAPDATRFVGVIVVAAPVNY